MGMGLNNMNDQELIQKVFNDKTFPTHPRIKIGEDKDGKPIYRFFLDISNAYVLDNKVKIDFISEAGKKMRYSFYFAQMNVDDLLKRLNQPLQGDFEMLQIGTEFV